jgi:hypothetical protein
VSSGGEMPALLKAMSIPPKAFAVIATETEASHDKDAATKLEGVQLGITLPLFVASRVVGTVGITGSPSTIRPFGEIVRAQTETMLRETMLVRLALLRDQALEELLADVAAFDAESSSQEALMTRGEELGFRLDLPRAAVVVTFSAQAPDRLDRSGVVLKPRLGNQLPNRATRTISGSSSEASEPRHLDNAPARATAAGTMSHTGVRRQCWKLNSVAGLLTPAVQAPVPPTGLCHVGRGAAPAAWRAGLDRCATGPVCDHLVPRRRP